MKAKSTSDLPPGEPVSSLLIMPERIDDNGLGYYGAEALGLYKELKAANADVAYYTVRHSGLNQFSAHDPTIVTFLVGFFVNDVPRAILYDSLKTYILSQFRKKPGPSTVKGKVYIASSSNKYEVWQEYAVTGNVDDAIKMIDKIQELHGNERGTRSKNPKR